MKKLFIALATLAAFTACSKMDVQFEQTGEITFTPISKNITKSMMDDGEVFNVNEQFNVWAFYNPTVEPNEDINEWVEEYNTLTTDGGAKIYIDDKTFAYDQTYSLWAGLTPYFWPKVGTLAFAGYHPTTANASYTLDSEKNEMIFSDIENSWVSSAETNTEDLMYFNLTKSYSENNVSAVFKHALSWLTVYISTTENTLKAGATITVNSVKFTDVFPMGDGTVENQEDIVWTPEGDAYDVEVVDSGLDLTKVPQIQKEPLFIPQDMNGNIVINYTISSTDKSSFTENKVIELNTMKDDKGNKLTKWEPGKHYIYNIVISTEEILIDPTVTPWTVVNVSQGVN